DPASAGEPNELLRCIQGKTKPLRSSRLGPSSSQHRLFQPARLWIEVEKANKHNRPQSPSTTVLLGKTTLQSRSFSSPVFRSRRLNSCKIWLSVFWMLTR